MREIELTQGLYALVDDEDYEELNKFKWHAVKFRNSYYAARSVTLPNGKTRKLLMHQQIIGKKDGYVIDHINGNGLDNRRCNLRHVTIRQNGQNLHIKKSSIYPGVNWHKNDKKWEAKIAIDGKRKHLGSFDNEEDAFRAYCKALETINEDLYMPNTQRELLKDHYVCK